ncbi:hypothetical protein BH11ARM2_BH11ARM2_39650 [soil metagenome]
MFTGAGGLAIGSIKGTSRLAQNFQKGKDAEMLILGLEKNTERLFFKGDKAAYRTPDQLDQANYIIGEVKNVNEQYLSSQLKRYLQFAQNNNFRMILYVDIRTKIAKPLQDLIDSGDIKLVRSKF